MKPRREVALISVNNTLTPRTGGEYVYKVIKEELLKQRYRVHEVSLPLLLKSLTKRSDKHTIRENLYLPLMHSRCILTSLLRRLQRRYLVITSSSPAFPVFGHIVYHQPKTGMYCSVGRENLSLYEKLGLMIHENEKLSPMWCLAKKSHILHLSNSIFTKHLVKNLYGLESFVLYPPVSISLLLNISLQKPREHTVIIARPKAISGITLLPKIVERFTKRVRLVVVGEADRIGLRVIQSLRHEGVDIRYLGYVSERMKLKLFATCSHYLHLGFNESFGITVVEAMAAGCIPIAPKSGAIPEYLPHDLLFSNSSEAAEKIASEVVLENHDLKIQLRAIAKQFKEEHFRSRFTTYVETFENLCFEKN